MLLKMLHILNMTFIVNVLTQMSLKQIPIVKFGPALHMVIIRMVSLLVKA